MAKITKATTPKRSVLLCIAILAGPVLVFPRAATRLAQPQEPASSPQRESKDINRLESGKTLDRKISAGQTHNYKISVNSGQFINLIVEQRALQLTVTLYAPGGAKLLGEFQNGLWAAHLIALVAQTSGDYRLEVQAVKVPPTAKSTYGVRFSELRVAGESEQRRAEAARLLLEAHELLRQQQLSESSRRIAAAKYEEARALFQAAGDRYGESLALSELGYNAFWMDQKPKGLDYLNQALSSWRSLGELQRQGSLAYGLAGLCKLSDQPEKAIEYFKEALALARSLHDRQLEIWVLTDMPSENPRDQFGRLLEVLAVARDAGLPEEEATALDNIGATYYSFGEYEEAIDYYKQANEIFRKIGETYWQGLSFSDMGRAYASLYDYPRAVDCFNQAIPLLHAAGRPNPEAGTMNSMAEAYESLGEPDKAIQSYGKVAELNKTSTIPIINPYARSRVGLARVAAGQGERDRAIAYLGEALALAPKYPPHLTGARCDLYVRIGLIFDKLGEGDKALDAFKKSLETARSIKSRGDEATALYQMASVQRNSRRLADARANAEAAIEIIESRRARIGDPQLRASYLSTVRKRYDLLTDILMHMHHEQPNAGFDGAALHSSERARARVLLDLLTEAQADIRQGIDAQLLDRERRLRQKLNAKAQQQTNLLTSKGSSEQLNSIGRDLTQLGTEHQQLEAEIRTRSPRYAALTQPRVLNVKEIQEQVLDADTMLLEYQLGDERSFMWLVTNNSLISFELPKRAEIDKAARQVYELLTARSRHLKGETPQQRQARIAAADAEYPRAALNLTRMILPAPATKAVGKRLLIVADGALQYVPFAALPDLNASKTQGETAPLVVSHEIVMLPSASVLAVLRKETNGRVAAPRIVATLADPVFDKDDPRVKSTAAARTTANERPSTTLRSFDLARAVRDFAPGEERGTLSRLPFTREEVNAILSVAPRGLAMAATDFKASRATAIDPQLSQYRIVHLATHALLNAQRPELSGIVFSLVDEAGQPQDGFLRLNEIYNLNLPADLVVLSACQTGLGKEINGEGLVGLTRGFMYAGAARVMASLWNINDSVTADIMKRFYVEMLRKGKSPSAALREAQLQMIRQKQWQEPYYWAAFVLQGEYK